MKKILSVLIFTLLLFSCGKKVEIPKLYPTDLITVQELQELTQNQHTLVLKDNAIKEVDNVSYIEYITDPIGAGDMIKISIMYPDEAYKSTYDCFKQSINKRSDAINVKGLSNEAYITFPSLHIYHDKYYITITAGSGSSDKQATLLTEIGKKVMTNYNNYVASNSNL